MNSEARFKTIVAGRRSGKTEFVTLFEVLPYLFLINKNVWIVAPTYDLTTRVWDCLYGYVIRNFMPYVKRMNSSKGYQRIETVFGTVIEAKSGDDPQSLVGKGLDKIIIDEAGILKEKCWTESLRPALADRGGSATFIGTPKGKNWFYNMYVMGQDPEKIEYESWQFPTSANDAVPNLISEMQKAKEDLPQMEYEQEWLAMFIEDAGSVFRNIMACANGELEEPVPKEDYVIGADWAKMNDYTVLVVARRSTRQVVAFERFNLIDFEIQKGRLLNLARKYNNAYVLIDQSGIGEPILDSLKAAGLNVAGFKTGSSDKEALINNLAIEMDATNIRYPDIKILKTELEIYERTKLPSGVFRYSAPDGMHDDCVIALALANWALKSGRIYFGSI